MKLMGDLLSIDSNKCTMCGECVIECPLSAIRGIANNRLFDKGSLVYDGSFTPSVKELLIYKKKKE
jgi:ferredoxin